MSRPSTQESVVAVAGFLALVVGSTLIYHPAGCLVAGAVLLAYAVRLRQEHAQQVELAENDGSVDCEEVLAYSVANPKVKKPELAAHFRLRASTIEHIIGTANAVVSLSQKAKEKEGDK